MLDHGSVSQVECCTCYLLVLSRLASWSLFAGQLFVALRNRTVIRRSWADVTGCVSFVVVFTGHHIVELMTE